MKNNAFALLCFVIGGLSTIPFHSNDDSEKRISELEGRVQRLENIVFSTSQLAQTEAERRLDNARQTLDHSRKLRKKGYITDAQLKNDQFALLQAEQELELAKATGDKARLGAELELLNAEQALTEARRELDYAKKLASRGFSTQFDVQRCERNLRICERAVELAKAKLEAFAEPGPSSNETEKSAKPVKAGDQ